MITSTFLFLSKIKLCKKAFTEFTKAVKVAILLEAQEKRIKQNLTEDEWSRATEYDWKWKFDLQGEHGLSVRVN